MARRRTKYFFIVLAALSLSCKRASELPGLADSKYPSDVGTIMLTKCAISGCHNDASYSNAGGLNLSTWDNLFKGAYVNGSVVIPYRSDFSSLCFFTNIYTDLGISLKPTMPVNMDPLSRAEYTTLRDWISSGAPDVGGNIPFAQFAPRKKIYITNRLCNVVTVVDEASLLQMRYVNVGNNSTEQYPHCIKVSPDKKNWYVSFFQQSNIVQKYNADTDSLAGELNIGSGSWLSFTITSDSKYGFFTDNSNPGKIAYVDLQNMSLLASYTFAGNFVYPSGIALNEHFHKLYVGANNGNFIYKIDITNPLSPNISQVLIGGTSTVQYQSLLDPIELLADTVSGKCFVACQRSGEIRVLDMQNDVLLDSISIGASPAFMAYSQALNKLFISCPDDMLSFSGNRGSIAIIDALSDHLTGKINSGYQPYGIVADDAQKIVAIVNANISGPASHHVSGCGQKNGNLSFIDLNTMNVIPAKALELAVYPFGAACK